MATNPEKAIRRAWRNRFLGIEGILPGGQLPFCGCRVLCVKGNRSRGKPLLVVAADKLLEARVGAQRREIMAGIDGGEIAIAGGAFCSVARAFSLSSRPA